ncbi:hypothetical protein V1517DRAFT_329007 [Lipomyces orientalis]|uniref:Uncharacterized protein n=1 Tax=Lipomyces orientalis TaxID=1233043 RepID=A0ACC3TI55_9ASCO
MSNQPVREIIASAQTTRSFDLEKELLQLFVDLHKSQPNHEIFGEVVKGLPNEGKEKTKGVVNTARFCLYESRCSYLSDVLRLKRERC